jgi:superfamily II DNA or RNA helicase
MVDQNSPRTLWQKEVINKWITNCKARGYTEICTGAGKSYIGILAIKLCNERHSTKQINVIVPTTVLKEAWTDEKKGHIKLHNLKNVNVYVVNTYVKTKHECALLLLDECQHYTNENSKTFNKVIANTTFNWILCLTATLEKEHKDFLNARNITLIEKFTAQQGVDAGWLSPYKVLCVPIELDESDRERYDKMHKEFNKHFATFNFDFGLAMKCVTNNDARQQLAESLNWEKGRIDAAVFAWNRNMRLRKDFLYHIESKINAAIEITKKLQMQSILFGQSIAGADKISEALGDECVEYHSKMTKKQAKENLKKLKDGRTKVKYISSAKGLEEGFDLPNLQLGVTWSRTSKALRATQITGRLLRYYPGKIAYMIELYVPATQDLKWLQTSLKGQKNVFWLSNIDQVYQIINQDKENARINSLQRMEN